MHYILLKCSLCADTAWLVPSTAQYSLGFHEVHVLHAVVPF